MSPTDIIAKVPSCYEKGLSSGDLLFFKSSVHKHTELDIEVWCQLLFACYICIKCTISHLCSLRFVFALHYRRNLQHPLLILAIPAPIAVFLHKLRSLTHLLHPTTLISTLAIYETRITGKIMLYL